LSGQAFQLVALTLGDKAHAEIAKDIGAHPFALGKLAPYAKRKGRSGVRDILRSFAKADAGMKTSAGEPWLLVEKALLEVANH
jgi:DNA polymerase III delta subunit